jgi:hypothetical protein
VRVTSPKLTDFQVHLPWAPAVVEVERGSLLEDDTRAPLTTRGVLVRADGGTASFRYEGDRRASLGGAPAMAERDRIFNDDAKLGSAEKRAPLPPDILFSAIVMRRSCM